MYAYKIVPPFRHQTLDTAPALARFRIIDLAGQPLTTKLRLSFAAITTHVELIFIIMILIILRSVLQQLLPKTKVLKCAIISDQPLSSCLHVRCSSNVVKLLEWS